MSHIEGLASQGAEGRCVRISEERQRACPALALGGIWWLHLGAGGQLLIVGARINQQLIATNLCGADLASAARKKH